MVVPLTRPAPPSQPIIFTSGFKTVKMELAKSETRGFKTGVQKPMGDVTKAPPTSIYSLCTKPDQEFLFPQILKDRALVERGLKLCTHVQVLLHY